MMPDPTCFNSDMIALIDRVLKPAFAFLDSDNGPVGKLARNIGTITNDEVQVVPGIDLVVRF